MNLFSTAVGLALKPTGLALMRPLFAVLEMEPSTPLLLAQHSTAESRPQSSTFFRPGLTGPSFLILCMVTSLQAVFGLACLLIGCLSMYCDHRF